MRKYSIPKGKVNVDLPKIRKFCMENSTEMSSAEMGAELGKTESQIKSICQVAGISYFSSLPSQWKRKGYIKGISGYAMYPYKGSYRQSASVRNEDLDND
jgi:hypothetical protein